MKLGKRDFISISDINEAEFWQILKLAKKLKDGRKEVRPLDGS